MPRRVPIGRKILLVYLATVAPLGIIALLVFLAWFSASAVQLLGDRLSNARLTGTSFTLVMQDLATASRLSGQVLLEHKHTQAEARLQLQDLASELALTDAEVLDASGVVRYSSDPRLLGASFATETAFQEVRAGAGTTRRTPVALGNLQRIRDGSRVFCVATPIQGSGGWIALCRVDVARFSARLPRSMLVGSVDVLDAAGVVVLNGGTDGEGLLGENWSKVPFVRAALNGHEASSLDFKSPTNDSRRVGAAVPVSEWGWASVASMDFGKATAPITTSMLRAIVISLLVIAVGLALGWRTVGTMLAGLRRLTVQSELLGEGDLAPMSTAQTRDEIEDVSTALESARADIASYIRGLAALAAAGRALSESLALPDVREAVIESARRLFGVEALWVFRYNERTDRLEDFLWYSAEPLEPPEVEIVPGTGVEGRAFAERRPLLVTGVSSLPGFKGRDTAAAHEIEAIAAVPLVTHDKRFGVLGVWAPGMERWEPGGREMSLLEAFAAQLSASLENARLYEELSDVAERLRLTLEEMQALITSAPSAIVSLDADARVLTWNPGAEKMFGYTAEEILGKPLPYVPEHERARFTDTIERMRRGETMTNMQVQRRRKTGEIIDLSLSIAPLLDGAGRFRGALAVLVDITDRLDAERRLRASEAKFRAVVEQSKDGIAIVAADKTVTLYNPAAVRITGYSVEEVEHGEWLALAFPDERERAEFEALAGRLVNGELTSAEIRITRKDGSKRWIDFSAKRITVDGAPHYLALLSDIDERKRFEQERERSRELASALNEINTSINAVLDFDEIVHPVLRMASRALGLDAAMLLLREEGAWVCRFVHHMSPDILRRHMTPGESVVARLATESKRPYAVGDTTDDAALSEFTSIFGIHAFIAVPLMMRGEVSGVLILASLTKSCEFSSLDTDFASKLGAAVSTALENARLYDEERTIADTLQESILAMPDQVPGIRFGSLYRSGTEAAQVGGDFYDLFELEHGRVGVLVGDVSGKGLRAASLTSLAKNTVRAYAYGGDSPGEALRKTNDIVYDSVSEATFLTIIFAVLDVVSGEVVYANAGHPAGLVRRRSGDVDQMPSTSMLLGAFPGVTFDEATLSVRHGDVILMFTDGITEARRDGQLFGEDRVRRWLADDGRRLSPEELPEVLLEHVASFAEGRLSDDVALLSVALAADETVDGDEP